MTKITQNVKEVVVQWLRDSLEISLEKQGSDWGQDKRMVLKLYLEGDLICKADVYD